MIGSPIPWIFDKQPTSSHHVAVSPARIELATQPRKGRVLTTKLWRPASLFYSLTITTLTPSHLFECDWLFLHEPREIEEESSTIDLCLHPPA